MNTNTAAADSRPAVVGGRTDTVSDLRRTSVHGVHSAAAARGSDLALPLGITIASMLAWALFQGWVLLGEQRNLAQITAGQQQQVEASTKVRQQLDAVASGMQRLAAAGNPNASLVVEELRKRGVTITLPAAPAAASQK